MARPSSAAAASRVRRRVTNVVNVVSGGSPVIDLEAISGGTNAINYGPTSTLYTGTIAHFSDGSVIQLPFAAGLNDPLALNDLLGWTGDPVLAMANQALASAAVVYLCRIPLPAGISVTNVIVNFTVAANNTLTHAFLALFNSAGTVIGQSADQSTTWATGGDQGWQTIPLVGGPFSVAPLAADDFLWAAIYVGTAAGTLPSFSKMSGAGSAAINIGTIAKRTAVRFHCPGQYRDPGQHHTDERGGSG